MSKTFSSALVWDRLSYVGAIYMAVFFIRFIFALRGTKDKKEIRKVFLSLYIFASLLALITFFTPMIIREVSISPFKEITGPFYSLFALLFLGTLSYGLFLLHQTYKKASGLKKEQIKYIFLGISVGAIASVFFFLTFISERIPSIHYLIEIGYVSIIAYAIIQHSLLDIKVTITRLAILGFLGGLVLVALPFILFPQDKLKAGLYGIIASTVWFLGFYLQRKVEDRLLKEQRAYLKTLEDTSKEMPLIKDLDRLMETIVINIVSNIGIPNAVLYLKNQEGYHLGYAFGDGRESLPKELVSDDPIIEELIKQRGPILKEESPDRPSISQRFSTMRGSVIIPCLVREELLGFLALGEKKSGKAYNPDDLKAFQGLSVPLALAMENALYLKELQGLHAQALEAAKFRAIRQMINSMSHEIGNLMMIACGKSQMLLMGKEKYQFSEEVVEMLKTINERGMTAAEILKEVSDYHKKSVKTEVVDFDITQTIEKSLERMQKLFQEIGVQPDKQIESRLGRFQGNENFGDLFYHLLKNSYYNLKKYQQSELRISAKRNGTGVEVVIRDQGGSFARHLDEDTAGGELFTERGSLGGVSLYLAKAIAQDHGIDLKVVSPGEEKGGFIVRIPYV